MGRLLVRAASVPRAMELCRRCGQEWRAAIHEVSERLLRTAEKAAEVEEKPKDRSAEEELPKEKAESEKAKDPENNSEAVILSKLFIYFPHTDF